jgi:hypothetical protein
MTCPAGSSGCGYVSAGDDRQDWEHMYWEHQRCADCGQAPRDGDSVTHRAACPRLMPGYKYPETGKQPPPAGLGWDCEGYGPPADTGALCFFADLGKRECASPAVCHSRMTAERQRMFDRIQEQAAAGDQTAIFLASVFTDPGQLLGGGAGDPEAGDG